MKKSLSMLLAVIMVLSVFSVAVIPAGAADVKSFFSVSKTDLVNDEITYTVNLKGGLTKITGAIVHIEYNPSELSVAACSAASTFSNGIFEKGAVSGVSNTYGIGFINANGITLSADSAFFTIKFKAISEDRPITTVKFNVVELTADNGVEHTKADAAQLFAEDSFHTLSKPVVTAVDSYGTNALKVQWNACQGADSYNIYRKTGSTGWGTPIATGITGVEYDDTSITTSKEYTYLVTAVNEAGETAVAGNGKAGMNFGAITNVTCTPAAKGITVTWGALSGAVKYDVLRKKISDATFTTIKEGVTATSYTDETAASGVEYNYIVKAYHSKGYTATTQMNPYAVGKFIAMPKLTAENTIDGIKVTLTRVDGANKYYITRTYGENNQHLYKREISLLDFNGDTYTYTYNSEDNIEYTFTAYAESSSVLKSAETSTKLKRIATPALGTIANVDSGVKLTWNAVSGATQYAVYRKAPGATEFSFFTRTTETSLVNVSAENGKTYSYTVAAENATGTGAYDTTGKTITRIATPTSVTAKTTANGVTIKWNAVSGAESYTVYRDNTNIGTVKTTTINDKPAKNTKYTYTVCANIGDYSSARTATGAEGMDFGTVSSISYKAIQNGVTVSWNKLDKAQGYRVWRKTASDAQYANIATVTSGTQYTDTRISSGVTYYYIVEAYNGNCVAEMTAPTLTVKYLSAPTFTAKNSGDDVKVTINAVYGAESYIIERAIGSSTSFTTVKTLPAATLEFVDSGSHIVAGQKYTYRITAVSGSVKSFSTTVSMNKMIAPKITSCYNEVAGVQLKWGAVADATQYKVWRRMVNDNGTYSSWTTVTTIGKTKTDFLDASVVGNKAYQYAVEANTPDGWTGGPTSQTHGVENRFIETPDLISRTNAVGGVTIKWNKVAGATSYRIYRRGAGVNYWYYLGDFPATLDTFTDLETANYFPNDAKKNAEAKPKSGNYYRYTVRASYDGKDSMGNAHLRYSGFDTNGLYLKYVATPKLKAVSNASNGITVTWNAINGGGSTWYRVYRRGAGSTYWYYLGATQKTSFTDTAVSKYNNQYYRYTVRAVAGTADSGWYSAFDTNGLFLKRIVNPTLVSATAANGGITVKWNAVAGTTGYYVYRKTASSSWTRVGTVGGTKNVTFVDKTAKKGTTYTYTVRACYGTTLSSYNTKGVSAKR